MKHATLLSSLLLTSVAFAQTEVVIQTAPGNADQVFYSLQNGVAATAPLANWDLAFEISGFTSSILVNTAKGHAVYHTGATIAEWATITAPDEGNWTPLNNAETSWSEGALTYGNDLNDGGFNLGWGTYNMATHVVAGSEVYAVLLDGTTWKKLRIDGLAAGTYMFTYANLDGTDEHVGSLVKTGFSGKNFGYWDMTAHASVDREPALADWDLVFTKYLSDLGVMWYGVAGVLQNPMVETAQLDGVDQATVTHFDAEGQYGIEMNIIGSDWKSYDGSAYQYVTDRAYFVKDVAGNIWKLLFIGYGGGATGTMTFTQELMSATSVGELTALNGQALVYPNPVEGGSASVVLDVPATEATLTIHDLGGKLVHSELLTGIAPLAVRTISVAELGTGAYVLRVQHAQGVASSKLIVP